MVVLDIFVIDRDLDHVAAVEGGGVLRPEGRDPVEQVLDGLDVAGRRQFLLGLADVGPDPSKLQQLHATSVKSSENR